MTLSEEELPGAGYSCKKERNRSRSGEFTMKEDMKALIADTFIDLLEKEDIDKITVTKVIGKCHISRQTFYYHFKDIMEVLEWTFRQATQTLTRRSLEEKNPISALTAYVSFVRKHKAKLEKLLYSRRWIQIEEMLIEAVTVYLKETTRGRAQDINMSYNEMDVMLRFYASGMVSVLLHYVEKPNMNEEKLVIQIEKIITGKMFPGKI